TTIALVLSDTVEKNAFLVVEKMRKVLAPIKVPGTERAPAMSAGIAKAVMRSISSRKSSTAWRAHWKSRVPQAGKRSTLLQPTWSPIWLRACVAWIRWRTTMAQTPESSPRRRLSRSHTCQSTCIRPGRLHGAQCPRYAVVVSRSVAVDDSDARSGAKRLAQVLKERNRFGYFMVGLEKQCRINAVRRQQGVVWMAKDGLDVVEALAFGALLNVFDGFRVDINGIDSFSLRDSAGGTNGKPS